MQDAADALQAKVPKPRPATRAHEVIAETVEAHHINQLVMGAYGHSRIRQLVGGSTTNSMARTCLVPVLMVR